jgi:hypothetical protein
MPARYWSEYIFFSKRIKVKLFLRVQKKRREREESRHGNVLFMKPYTIYIIRQTLVRKDIQVPPLLPLPPSFLGATTFSGVTLGRGTLGDTQQSNSQ